MTRFWRGKKWARILLLLFFIVLLLISFFFLNEANWRSQAYDWFMAFDYRPVISRDKLEIKTNLAQIEQNLLAIEQNCPLALSAERQTLESLKQELNNFSFRNFVYDLNQFQKKVFLFYKQINDLRKECLFPSVKRDSPQEILTFTVTSANYNRTIDLSGADSSSWQNNWVMIENKGETAVQPQVFINNQNFASLENILSVIIKNEMTNKEKALAIWQFVKEHKYSFRNPTAYVPRTSLDLINSWGYGNCGYTARAVIDLATLAGLVAREHRLGGHIVSEIYYDEAWHILDADGGVYYSKTDGTLASVGEVAQNLELLRNFNSTVYTYNYLETAYKSTENNLVFAYQPQSSQKFAYLLRPNEAVLFSNSNKGDYFSAVNYAEPPEYSNSYFIYQPEEPAKIISFYSPFPLVGGVIEGKSSSSVQIYLSRNKWTWDKIYQGDAGEFKIDFSSWFINGYNTPDQEYYLRFEEERVGEIRDLRVISEVQVAKTALPLLQTGKTNQFEFRDLFNNPLLNVQVTILYSPVTETI